MLKQLTLGLLCALLTISTLSCTQKERARNFGGKTTINLPVGQKLFDVTWKEDNIWYATRPMRTEEFPETYTFKEDSSYGIFEGTVVFVEHR